MNELKSGIYYFKYQIEELYLLFKIFYSADGSINIENTDQLINGKRYKCDNFLEWLSSKAGKVTWDSLVIDIIKDNKDNWTVNA